MSNIATKLSEMSAVKSALKGAIASKDIDMTNVPFTEYASKIDEISTTNIDVIWVPSDGTSFFTKETSGFEHEPYISDSESSYGSAYCIYANPSSTAKISFPVDFRQYKYYGIIFGAYSYYSEGENNLKVECGNFIRKSSTSGAIAPITCFLSSDNTGIAGSGKCYLTRTRGTNGSTRAYIYKIFATNIELSNLMI